MHSVMLCSSACVSSTSFYLSFDAIVYISITSIDTRFTVLFKVILLKVHWKGCIKELSCKLKMIQLDKVLDTGIEFAFLETDLGSPNVLQKKYSLSYYRICNATTMYLVDLYNSKQIICQIQRCYQ